MVLQLMRWGWMPSEDLVNGVRSQLGISKQSADEADKLWDLKVDEGTLVEEVCNVGQ